jgi:hypothetical protein
MRPILINSLHSVGVPSLVQSHFSKTVVIFTEVALCLKSTKRISRANRLPLMIMGAG